MLHEFIRDNFVVVVNVLFLLVFFSTNTVFDKRITKHFLVSIIILIVTIVAGNMEYALSFRTTPTMLRTVVTMLGYSLRPYIIYVLILILKYDTKREKWLVAIPAILNTVVQFSALFCGLAFYYNDANEFVRGPLGHMPQVCSVFYLLLILNLSVSFFKERNYMEAGIVLTIVVVCGVAMLLESVWEYRGMLRTAISLSITFFYLYFCVQTFKRDALTKVLNRHCFYLDSEKNKDKMMAVLSIDLNNLKKINDFQGHAAGDTAIYTTAECIRKNLLKGCTLYRTGGDEFMVLCQKNAATIEQLQAMINDIYEDMKKTPYQCAIGMAEYIEGESFNSLCARADEMMYQKKKELKEAEL